MKQQAVAVTLLLLSSASLIYGVPPGCGSHSQVFIFRMKNCSAPRFTEEPENRVVVAQRNSVNVKESFPCGFEGTDVTVTWYRNNVALPADTSHIIHPNGTLEITAIVVDVDASKLGLMYHCVLSNEVGSVRSRTALVQLASFDPWNGVSATPIMVNVTLGSYILLPCNPPMANPAPKVKWTFNSLPIDITTTDKYKVLLPSGDLIIGNVVMSDITTATYQCHVINMMIFNNISSPDSYQLRLVDRYNQTVIVYNTLQNTMLQIGSNAEFVCLAIASNINIATHRLDYLFRKIEPGDLAENTMSPSSTTSNTNIDVRHTLFVNGVIRGNEGRYSCAVRNFTIEDASATTLQQVFFDISVFASPEITSFPSDLIMYTGDSIPLPCAVTGIPDPSISYRVNTSMLSVTGGALTSVSVADSGAYQCFAENTHGVATASWTITVRDPVAPLILNMSGDGTVFQGNTLDIFIEVSADPMPSVDWQLDGVSFNSSDKQMFTMREFNTTACPVTYLLELRVVSFTRNDSGQYSVVIKNRAGTVKRSFTRLLEEPVMVTAVTGVGERCLIRNENTNLTCSVTGVPTPTIGWFRIGGSGKEPITSNDKFTVMGNTLIINMVTNDDNGRYGCTATNTVNRTMTSTDANELFSVCAFPIASNIEMTGETLVGGRVTLTCAGSGDPDPMYTWYRDENGTRTSPMETNRIQVGVDHSTMDSFLEFTTTKVSDSGTYVCVVSNSAGTTETVFELEVEPMEMERDDGDDFPLWAIIVAAGGGTAVLIVLVILIILIVRCSLRSKTYGVTQNGGPHGKDEEDDNQPYNPQYESLPAPRPMRPPEYKPTPEYPSSVTARTPVPYGGSMMEMQKVSNTDLSKAHMYNYNSTSALTNQDMTDGMQQPRYDDFLSSDGQFV